MVPYPLLKCDGKTFKEIITSQPLIVSSLADIDGGSIYKRSPLWEKSNLSLEKAAGYSGIGINKLRALTNNRNYLFALWIGNKRLIKRRLFDQYIEQAYSIRNFVV